MKILHGNVDDRELQLAFFLEGAGFVAVWMPVLILVTFGVGSFAAAWLKFRKM